LAQACWIEAGFSLPDCAAIAFVVARRAELAGVTFAEMLADYSALDAPTPRARKARRFPDGDVRGMTPAWNEDWARLREHAAAVMWGEVEDPCDGAQHWGSRRISSDVQRAQRALADRRWAVVRCADRTVNRFYRVRGLRAPEPQNGAWL